MRGSSTRVDRGGYAPGRGRGARGGMCVLWPRRFSMLAVVCVALNSADAVLGRVVRRLCVMAIVWVSRDLCAWPGCAPRAARVRLPAQRAAASFSESRGARGPAGRGTESCASPADVATPALDRAHLSERHAARRTPGCARLRGRISRTRAVPCDVVRARRTHTISRGVACTRRTHTISRGVACTRETCHIGVLRCRMSTFAELVPHSQ